MSGTPPIRGADLGGGAHCGDDVHARIVEVIDQEPRSWFLLQESDSLFLDVNCSLSAFGYSWLIRLNSDERAEYRARGHVYLDELAESVHFSAPAAADTTSPYKHRDCTREYGARVLAAVKASREGS